METPKKHIYINEELYFGRGPRPVVEPWFEAGPECVLDEDGGSGHSTHSVRKWKEDDGLNSYFNCVHLLDLPPIGNCWLISKSHAQI